MSVDELTRRDIAAIEYEHGSNSAEVIAKMLGQESKPTQTHVGLYRGMPNQEHITAGRVYSHGRYNAKFN